MGRYDPKSILWWPRHYKLEGCPGSTVLVMSMAVGLTLEMFPASVLSEVVAWMVSENLAPHRGGWAREVLRSSPGCKGMEELWLGLGGALRQQISFLRLTP